MVAIPAVSALPWRPTAARRPSSASFGHVQRNRRGPPRSQRRPGSAPPRPSYVPSPSKGVARRERTNDDLPNDAEAVDVEASWPHSFVETVVDDPIPTMASGHSEHARFIGKSAQRREHIAAPAG